MPFLLNTIINNHSPASTIEEESTEGNKGNGGNGDGESESSKNTLKFWLLTDAVQITAPIPDYWHKGICSLALDNCKDFENYKSLYAGNKEYKYVYQKYVNGSAIFFEICPKPSYKSLPFLRFKFNPSKLGEQGIVQLQAELDTLVSQGWKHILQHGRITRLDITLDVAGISLDSIVVFPNIAVTTTVYKRNGHIETIYLGCAKSANQWRIYNKAAELKSKGVTVACGDLVRFERRIRTNIKIENLSGLKNPFKTLTVGLLPVSPQGINPKRWAMFCDSVHMRGVGPALSLIPEKKTRMRYRNAIKNAIFDWWEPDHLFNVWKAGLMQSGLLSDY